MCISELIGTEMSYSSAILRRASAAHPLELRPRLGVERVAQMVGSLLIVRDGLHVAEERSGRALLHLLPGRPPDCDIGRDETDLLRGAVLDRELLEECVRIRGVPHLERAV